jgi:2-oxoglutarate dehydrogenase E1 component
MTPKSLLRHPACVSSLSDLSSGTFRPVLGDQSGVAAGEVRKVLLCSGKLYYELAERRESSQAHDVAIVRIEEFYPLPQKALEDALAHFPTGTPVAWVQDEPENMGALRFLKVQFGDMLFGRFPQSYIGRPESSSPATGSHRSHQNEQETLLKRAFE